MKHIDSHVHLYPEKLMNAIYRYFERLDWRLPFRGGVEEALSHMKGNGVEKAFLLLYSHKAGMSLELNRWAHELCEQHPLLIPFGCYFPDDEEPDALVRACLRDWGFAGFKLHFNVQKYYPDDPRYFPVYRGVLEYGGGIITHIGTFPNPGEHLGPERLLSVLKKFPKLKVAVAHLGFYQTEEFWHIMDRYPGVFMDTAFILGNPQFCKSDRVVYETLRRFPDRVLYGSDFPLICHHLGDGLDYVGQLLWEKELKQKLMYDNANHFLRQKP